MLNITHIRNGNFLIIPVPSSINVHMVCFYHYFTPMLYKPFDEIAPSPKIKSPLITIKLSCKILEMYGKEIIENNRIFNN